MSTYVFGGNPVQPSSVDYHFYDGFTSPLQLVWPSSFVDTDTTQATIMLFNTDDTDTSVYMPQANQVGKGTSCIAYNQGAESINFYDFDGQNLLFSLDAGQAQWICVSGNDDEEGDWLTFVYGAGTSSADANALAGFGLISLPVTGQVNTLNTQFLSQTLTTTPYSVTTSDRASLLIADGCTQINLIEDLDDLYNGFFFLLYNASPSAILTVNAPTTGTINGESFITLIPGRSCIVSFIGSNNYLTVGLESVEAQTLSLVTIPVTGSSLDLSAQQLLNNIIVFTGTLASPFTAYFNSVDPDEWTIHNQTDGDNLSCQFGSTASPLGELININQNSAIQIYSNPDDESLYVVSTAYPVADTAYVPLVSGVEGTPIYYGSLVAATVSYTDTNTVTIPAGGAVTAITDLELDSSLQTNSFIQVTFSLSFGFPPASTGFLSLYVQVNGANETVFGTNPVAVLPLAVLGSNDGIYPFTFTFVDDPTTHPDTSYSYTVTATNSDVTNDCYFNRSVAGTTQTVSNAFIIQLMKTQ